LEAGYKVDRTAAKQHQFVTSNSRCFSAVRIEVVMSAKNFLSQRLNIETDGTLQLMTTVTNANTCNDFVSACVAAVKLFTSSNKQQQLVHECCDAWEDISGIPVLDTVDAGTKTNHRLRHLYAYSTGVLKFLLGSFLVVSPHSMGTERVVSHHNKLKSIQRASLSNETVNDRLVISINGGGTTGYDPRPAVAALLQKKDRRNREPQTEIYQQREFIQKFFRVDSHV